MSNIVEKTIYLSNPSTRFNNPVMVKRLYCIDCKVYLKREDLSRHINGLKHVQNTSDKSSRNPLS